MSERDERRHVATDNDADADTDALQAVVEFIDDLVERDEPGGAGRADGGGDGEVSPEAPRT